MSSLKQVAESAGVSIRTASLVLNGDYRANRITERRARMVQDVAKRLAYRPNSAARSMISGRFGAIAMVMSTDAETSYLPQQMLDGMQLELGRHDLNLIVTSVPDQKLTATGYVPRILRERMADGMILNYQYKIPAGLAELIEDRHLPAVWINVKRPADAAYIDDFEAGVLATRHLMEAGHRRIAYADLWVPDDKLPRTHYSNLDRQKGYEFAMHQAQLAALVVRPESLASAVNGPLGLVEAALNRSPRPTAVIGYGGESVGPFAVVASAMGLNIPRDLSLMTFGQPWASPIGLSLSIVELPFHDLGKQVAQLALQKVARPLDHLPSVALISRLIEGDSVAPPPASSEP